MVEIGESLNRVFDSSESIVKSYGLMLLVIVVCIVFLLGVLAWWNFKKRWNLKVEIKLIRSDGKIVIGEWGKGMFNAKRGVVFIRREGEKFKSIPMKVFDVKRYLQGDNLLTVIQVGPEDYRPVLYDSWTEHVVEYKNTETGEYKTGKESILNIKIDRGLNKAWKSAWEAAAKKAYSLQSFFQQFQTPISIAIVLVAVFVGFAMVWTRLGHICG